LALLFTFFDKHGTEGNVGMRRRMLSLPVLLALLLISLPLMAETLRPGLNNPQSGRYRDQGLQQPMGTVPAVEQINADDGPAITTTTRLWKTT
jgi:hypothetical protein